VKKRYIIFLSTIVLILSTCINQTTFADLFDLRIQIPNADQLLADSTSSAVVEIEFGAVLNKNQEVEVTTSHGLLFAQPYTPEETATASKSLKLNPFDDRAEVLLLTHTLTPTDPVFLSVTVNGLSEAAEISYLEALPEDLQLKTETPIVSASTEDVIIQADLYREKGFSSNGLRFVPRAEIALVDSSQMNELLWVLPEFVLSKNNQVTVPLTILQHASGSELRVFLSPLDGNIQIPEKSILLRFE
jgi:hypothetical protein